MTSSAALAVRVVLWQVIVVTAVAAYPLSPLAALAGAGLLAASALRVRGRWCDQWVASYLRYRGQPRTRPARILGSLLPTETRVYADRAGNRVGLAGDEHGWTAVLRLAPLPDDGLADRLDGLLSELDGGGHSGDIRLAAVQLTGWAIPAAQRTVRAYWVAVRFEPARDPEAVRIRGGGDAGAVQAAGVAALRVATYLRHKGYALRALDGTELLAELALTLGADEHGTSRETWRSWSAGPLHHACFRLRRLPAGRSALAAALTWTGRPPAVSTCASVTYPGPQVVVRFAVPGGVTAIRAATAAYARLLSPMNGEHGDGVRATIPLGYRLGS